MELASKTPCRKSGEGRGVYVLSGGRVGRKGLSLSLIYGIIPFPLWASGLVMMLRKQAGVRRFTSQSRGSENAKLPKPSSVPVLLGVIFKGLDHLLHRHRTCDGLGVLLVQVGNQRQRRK